jgi:H+/Na+-translocating ferredoxin:NAD+ oxidoreductase subunit C
MSSHSYQGLQLPTHKQRTRGAAIVAAPVPDVLVLPLNQHSDADLLPCVAAGDTVCLGQVIARAVGQLSARLHAPVSGTVLVIEPRATPQWPDRLTLAIVLANDGRDARDPALQRLSNWQSMTPLGLCEHLARGGITGLGGAVFPAAIKLAAHAQQPIEYLLINGVECEPFISCDDRLMRERAEQVVQGAQIMLHAAQAGYCKIGVEADKPEALAALRAAVLKLADARIEVAAVATAYPNGDEGQLITQLLGREIPRGGLPAQVGVIVQNVATACACAQWIYQAQPLISRIVTVTGPGVQLPANLEVRLGTPISDLIEDCGGYCADVKPDLLIMGGTMMGRSLPDDNFPIVKASNCLIVTRHDLLKPVADEMPCIRCGECAQACPENLLPQQLLAYTRNDNHVALLELGLPDCIECGCCDYVCPSHITLAGRFRAAKQIIRN